MFFTEIVPNARWHDFLFYEGIFVIIYMSDETASPTVELRLSSLAMYENRYRQRVKVSVEPSAKKADPERTK